MSNAIEVILSGGSAGGLAVFYNIDHLADKLGPGVRLTGFPDAGFFLDEVNVADNQHTYRNIFIGADPVWNVTGSGGTNLACLQFYKGTGDRYVVVLLFALRLTRKGRGTAGSASWPSTSCLTSGRHCSS